MIVIPSKRFCERFYLTYELKGAQRAVDLLSRYYGIRRMKIVVDGRRVGNSDQACYEEHVAYFKKKRLNKRNVLHEFYHHHAYFYEWDMSDKREEREANWYRRIISKRF